jgi:hypothetical protein
MESLCAVTSLDLLLCCAAGKDQDFNWADLAPAMTRRAFGSAGHDRRRAVLPRGAGYQIRTRAAGSSHSTSVAPTPNAP